MIQDISPHKLDNHFQPDEVPEETDLVLAFSGENILCRVERDRVSFPHVCDLAGAGNLVYLFALDGQRFFLCLEQEPFVCRIPDRMKKDEPGNQGNISAGDFAYLPLRSLRKKNAGQKPLIFAAVTARHLNAWYRSARFCGGCGKSLQASKTERAMVCPACGRTFYPRINPAVIVGVTNGDNLLLTKYAGRNLPFYALVAGFTEIGETFEETVQREVMEETGLMVTNIRYYKSQPWGFSGDILAGYFCDVTGSPDIRMDTHELKEALWMPRKEVPGQPDDFSLTNEMMLAFRDGLV